MTRRALLLLVVVLALVSSGLARPAAAQVVFGLSAVEYNPESTLVSGYSLTLLDFTACLYYDAYVEGFLFEDLTVVDDDGERGFCVAEAFTDDFGTGGHFYTQLSDHYIVAFVWVPGFGFYDPFGYGLFGGEYGDSHDFYGCFCPAYYFEEFIYLGSTAATIFLEPPCNKTPTLKATPTSVARGGTVTFTLENLCPQRTIKDWVFVDAGKITVERATDKGATTWKGKIVKTGLVAVTVTQGGITLTPFANVTVTDRTSGFSFPKVASREDTSYPTGCTAPSFPSPPEPNKELGEYCLLEQWSFTPGVVGNGDNDNGPNKGYHYIVSARHTSTSGAPTQFVYIIHPELKSTTTEFYRAQCGEYDPATDTGFTSGDQLLANARNHEGGEKNSHYQHYVDALEDKTKNIGDGLEQVVGPPGETDVDFKNRANEVAADRNKLMQDATRVEPCGTGFIRDPQCHSQGFVNYAKTAQGQSKPYSPCRPSGLMTTSITASKVDLKWTSNSPTAQQFAIKRRKSDSAEFLEVGRTPANQTTFPDTLDLAPSTDYVYAVQAVIGTTFSYDSNHLPVHTPSSGGGGGGGSAPAAPTGAASAGASSSQVTITWTDNSTNEEGFRIERRTGSGSFAQIATVGANVTSYNDSTVSASTNYTYRVAAFNASGTSPYSNEISTTTAAPPSGLAAPASFTAVALSSVQVQLSWTDTSSGEDGFKIERKTGAELFDQIGIVGPSVTGYVDVTVTPNTAYTYRVRAYKGALHSPYSNEAATTTQGLPLPAPAGNLTATLGGPTRVDLAWVDQSWNELGFRVERKTDNGAFAPIATVPANVAAYSDTSVAAFTTYTYRVVAFGEGGSTLPSNWATVTTPSAQGAGPAAPCCLQAWTGTTNSGGAFVSLTWADLASDETSFRVERRLSGESAWSTIATLPADSTSFGDNFVSLGWTYQYRVGAVNLLGINYSGEVEVTAGEQ